MPFVEGKGGRKAPCNWKAWTGFTNSEEKYADEFIGKRMQPFWIEDEARKLPDTNFIVSGRFKSHVVHDGNLITGQQQYSGTAVARLMIGVGHLAILVPELACEGGSHTCRLQVDSINFDFGEKDRECGSQ
jgi:hypothetical protein